MDHRRGGGARVHARRLGSLLNTLCRLRNLDQGCAMPYALLRRSGTGSILLLATKPFGAPRTKVEGKDQPRILRLQPDHPS